MEGMNPHNDDSDNNQPQQQGNNDNGKPSSSVNAPPMNVPPAPSPDAAPGGIGVGAEIPPLSPQESVGSVMPPPPPPRATVAVVVEELGKRKRAYNKKSDEAGGSGPASSKTKFDGPDVATPCSVCHKTFPSWKALFGHMRSHPERTWRGVHPPPTFNREDPVLPNQQPQQPQVNVGGGEQGETAADYLLKLATQVKDNMEREQQQRARSGNEAAEAGESLAAAARHNREFDFDLNQPHENENASSEETRSLDLNYPPGPRESKDDATP